MKNERDDSDLEACIKELHNRIVRASRARIKKAAACSVPLLKKAIDKAITKKQNEE